MHAMSTYNDNYYYSIAYFFIGEALATRIIWHRVTKTVPQKTEGKVEIMWRENVELVFSRTLEHAWEK